MRRGLGPRTTDMVMLVVVEILCGLAKLKPTPRLLKTNQHPNALAFATILFGRLDPSIDGVPLLNKMGRESCPFLKHSKPNASFTGLKSPNFLFVETFAALILTFAPNIVYLWCSAK